jgi:hypothetical protein
MLSEKSSKTEQEYKTPEDPQREPASVRTPASLVQNIALTVKLLGGLAVFLLLIWCLDHFAVK